MIQPGERSSPYDGDQHVAHIVALRATGSIIACGRIDPYEIHPSRSIFIELREHIVKPLREPGMREDAIPQLARGHTAHHGDLQH